MHTHALMSPFTPIWWKSILTVIGIIVLVCSLPYFWKSLSHKRFAQIIGVLLLLNIIIENVYSWYLGTWTLDNNLPLQLCSISGILSGLMLLNYQYKWAELLYYWGLTGGIHSLLTPEFTHGMEGYFFYGYFIGHGGLLLAIFYMIFHFKFRPTPGSWWRAFLFTQMLALGIGCINFVFNSNYMYLCQPPIAENPLIMGAWPWYLLVFEALAIVHFGLFYLPFKLRAKRNT